jgi:hypothetical protein
MLAIDATLKNWKLIIIIIIIIILLLLLLKNPIATLMVHPFYVEI